MAERERDLRAATMSNHHPTFSLAFTHLPPKPLQCRYKGIMSTSESVGNNTQKKLIKIDISSNTMCSWCFVGKKNLDKAIAAAKDYHDFEVCSARARVFACVCTHVCVPTLFFYQLHSGKIYW
ncbi:hypothetical protein ACB092_07G138100 [Castanea dentata]